MPSLNAPDLSETRPLGLPEAPSGPSGEGRAPSGVRLAPLDYRTHTLGAHCPRSSGVAGRPQCRQPEVPPSFSWAEDERPPARLRSIDVLIDIGGWRHWGRAA